MKRFVLDASVALRWLLDDPVSPYAERVKQLLIKGARATVPALWHLEMSNGLAGAERRSILSPANIDQALLHIEQIVSQRVDTSSAFVSTRQSLATARQYNDRATRSLSVLDSNRVVEGLGRLPEAYLQWALDTKAGTPIS